MVVGWVWCWSPGLLGSTVEHAGTVRVRVLVRSPGCLGSSELGSVQAVEMEAGTGAARRRGTGEPERSDGEQVGHAGTNRGRGSALVSPFLIRGGCEIGGGCFGGLGRFCVGYAYMRG